MCLVGEKLKGVKGGDWIFDERGPLGVDVIIEDLGRGVEFELQKLEIARLDSGQDAGTQGGPGEARKAQEKGGAVKEGKKQVPVCRCGTEVGDLILDQAHGVVQGLEVGYGGIFKVLGDPLPVFAQDKVKILEPHEAVFLAGFLEIKVDFAIPLNVILVIKAQLGHQSFVVLGG